MPATKKPAAKKAPAAKPAAAKAAAERMSLAEVMAELKKNGSEATKKTYLRHGGKEPMFGVQFGFLHKLWKRIRVDHDLALALWATGNFDARNLAMKIVDPARITPAELDRWAREMGARMLCGYVGSLAMESPYGFEKLDPWLSSKDDATRATGWNLLCQLAMRDETKPDSWFAARLASIEKSIHSAPNSDRGGMNMALITIGGRNRALRELALASAKRIGRVDVDHGDTACKTPDAAEYLKKMWARSESQGHDSPAAHERSMESQRTRC